MQPLHVPAGAAIFKAGDPSHAVYLIEDGEVSITVRDGVEVARLHPGELFGESGVLEARARSATATAVTAATLLVTEAETFVHAFGMDNDRALSLVKLLCRRLRSTTLRTAATVSPNTIDTDSHIAGHAAIRLLPASQCLSAEYGMTAVDVLHLPFQVGNRFGGETLPIASNHSCSIPARGVKDLGAPHFEILRRNGRIGVRDLGTSEGTIVNGAVSIRTSTNSFIPLHQGDNDVVAGRATSPFRFRIQVAGA